MGDQAEPAQIALRAEVSPFRSVEVKGALLHIVTLRLAAGAAEGGMAELITFGRLGSSAATATAPSGFGEATATIFDTSGMASTAAIFEESVLL
jgi:hypothetical protein